MRKDTWNTVRDYIVRHCKIVFPVLVIVIVAITVAVALKGNKNRSEAESLSAENSAQDSRMTEGDQPMTENVPLVANEDEAIFNLVSAYYQAMGEGDMEKLLSIYDDISENDLLYYGERAKYIDNFADLTVYTKQGPAEGATIVYVYYKMAIVNRGEVPGYETLYVCTNQDGQLYVKNESNCTEEERTYIKTANEQVDVVEFNNRVNVEYNELMSANPELLEYLGILGTQVNTSVGEMLSNRIQGTEGQPDSGNEGQGESGDSQGQDVEPEAPVEEGPQYATATTTVNVRSSDSEQADKIGKVSSGTRVQVQEVRVNGWTKILYEKKDGYIKSEFLQMEESAVGVETIGTVTATTNINVRSAASESASRLGILAGGDSLDLIANENGWCKVKYNGQIGYVKADYVTQQ